MNVKGMKGNDYSRILNWYRLIMQSTSNLVTLMELERNDSQALGMTMNVLKGGLLSEDCEVSTLCARVLNKVCSTLQERANQNEDTTPLISLLWEWFTQGNQIVVQKPRRNSLSPKKRRENKHERKQKELEAIMNEPGLLGFIRALRMHQSEFNEIFVAAIVQYG